MRYKNQKLRGLIKKYDNRLGDFKCKYLNKI